MDAEDYYSKKLRTEIDEHNAILSSIEKDFKTSQVIAKEMKAFVSAVFGNDGWIKLVEARFLRQRQGMGRAEYDPDKRSAVKVYVKGYYQPNVPRQLIDELPTHGTDQFGDYHSRMPLPEPQMASSVTYNRLAGA